jgi:hypothetical protein
VERKQNGSRGQLQRKSHQLVTRQQQGLTDMMKISNSGVMAEVREQALHALRPSLGQLGIERKRFVACNCTAGKEKKVV